MKSANSNAIACIEIVSHQSINVTADIGNGEVNRSNAIGCIGRGARYSVTATNRGTCDQAHFQAVGLTLAYEREASHHNL